MINCYIVFLHMLQTRYKVRRLYLDRLIYNVLGLVIPL
jgi:hypothetical protein